MARPLELFSWEGTTMIFLGILISVAAIGFFCWLLFFGTCSNLLAAL